MPAAGVSPSGYRRRVLFPPVRRLYARTILNPVPSVNTLSADGVLNGLYRIRRDAGNGSSVIFMFRGGRSVLICSEKEGALTKPFGQAVRKVYSKVRDVPTHGGTLRYYPDGSPYDGKGRTVQRCQPVRCWFSRGRDSGFARNGG